MLAAYIRTDADKDSDSAALEAPIVYAKWSGDEDLAGPKKKGPRWNAVRHGCMAKILLPADLQAEVDVLTVVLTERYLPTTAFEVEVIARMGRLGAQLNRLQKMMVISLQRTMDRAVVSWHPDRSIYVDKLVERLGTDPGVARALTRSRQGVDWLLKTWRCVAEVVEFTGKWTEDQFRLAMDLLGIRPELRDGYFAMLAESDGADLTAVMNHEIDRLEESLEDYLIALDDADQSMAAAGMPMEEDEDTKRLRKQEARLKLEYRRAKAELTESRDQAAQAAAGPAAPASPAPAPAEPPAPVATSVLKKPDEDPGPPPRPKVSRAAARFLEKRSALDALELPATATAPARRVSVQFPFPGGEPRPEPAAEPEPASELPAQPAPEPLPAIVSEPAAAPAPKARVRPDASAADAAAKRLEQDRLKRRALEKKARKAARRRRR